MSIKFNWWGVKFCDHTIYVYIELYIICIFVGGQWLEIKAEFTLLSSQWSFPKHSNNPNENASLYMELFIKHHRVDFPKCKVQILTRKVERNENPSFTSHFTPTKTMEIFEMVILLMEKILHHLGCPKTSWYWDKTNVLGILSGADFFPSTVFLSQVFPPSSPRAPNENPPFPPLEVEVRSSTCSYCAAGGMKPCDVDAGVVLWSNIHAVCVKYMACFFWCRSVCSI